MNSFLVRFSIASPSNLVKSVAILLCLLEGTLFAQSQAPAESGSDAVQAEQFELPASLSSFDQLRAFVEEIDNLEPSGQGELEMVAHQRKVARTVVAAAGKVFSQKDISEEDAMQSIFLKFQGLLILQQLNEPKAGEMLARAIEAARADERPDVQALGLKFMVETGFAQWATWGEEERSGLVDAVIKDVSSHQPKGYEIQMVSSIVDILGDMNGEKYALQLTKKLIPHFQSSTDPQVLQALVSLMGTERRLKLPGNPIELNGTLLDGSKLDWASYRGKVVLVDFWATWCHPCRAEVPNILEMYEAYHDKGFEVLGISLDKTREEAESYIKQTKIPWATMFSEIPEERFWKHPMVVRYGINGIPRAILVDRDGKVVNMTARGEILVRELRRLLGEPVAQVQQREELLIQQVSSPPSGN